jgi:hypothetical protein
MLIYIRLLFVEQFLGFRDAENLTAGAGANPRITEQGYPFPARMSITAIYEPIIAKPLPLIHLFGYVNDRSQVPQLFLLQTHVEY